MPHEISQYRFELNRIDDFFAGDTRVLAFTVVDADGNGVNIENATLKWRLVDREYEDRADAVLDDSESDVTIDTSSPIDPTAGEFEVQLDPAATDDLWGEYAHVATVEQTGGSEASWRGSIIISA